MKRASARDESETAVKAKPPRVPRHDREQDGEDSGDIDIRDRRRRREGSSRGMLWLGLALGGGAVILLLACVGAGVAGFFLFARDSIVGQWDLVEPQINVRLTVEFRADNTGVIRGPGADVFVDYTLDRKDPMTLDWTITRVDAKQQVPFGGPMIGKLGMQPMARFPMLINAGAVGMRERFRVKLEPDKLTLTPDNNNPPLAFRRLR
jgi:hypothetical protein